VVGVNVSKTMMDWAGQRTLDDHLRLFSDALMEVSRSLQTAVSLVFVPHDSRGELGDHALSARIQGLMSEDLRARTMLAPAGVTAQEAKAIAGVLDIALSSRMHFAIACLGMGTPVLGLGYQDKFDGLFELFGLRDLLIDSRTITSSASVAAVLARAIEARESLRRRVEEQLPAVGQMARLNLAWLAPAATAAPDRAGPTERPS
jgi:polysaccharide pyruvyl transferase WcaK-like protein